MIEELLLSSNKTTDFNANSNPCYSNSILVQFGPLNGGTSNHKRLFWEHAIAIFKDKKWLLLTATTVTTTLLLISPLCCLVLINKRNTASKELSSP